MTSRQAHCDIGLLDGRGCWLRQSTGHGGQEDAQACVGPRWQQVGKMAEDQEIAHPLAQRYGQRSFRARYVVELTSRKRLSTIVEVRAKLIIEISGKPVLITLGVYVVIMLIITRGIVIDSGLTVLQKFFQILIIWLIPVIGASLVLAMQGNNYTRTEMRSLVPFPFYLAGYSKPRDGSLTSAAQDGAGDGCGEGACGSD